MKSWARIHRDAGESQRLTKLLCEHPVSDALFWRLKAWADDYGRCTADPYKLASRLAPRCVIEGGLNVETFAQAIRDWAECRVVQLYEVDGEPYLELADYDSHDDPLWLNVPRPEYPAPPWWTPPQSLVCFLRRSLKLRNVTLERYGIGDANCPPELRYALPAGQPVEQPAQQPVGQPVQQSEQHPTPPHPTQRPPLRGDGNARAGSAGAAPRCARKATAPSSGKQPTADGTARASPPPEGVPDEAQESTAPATLLPEQIWLLAGIQPLSDEPEERRRHGEAKRAFLRGEEGPVNGYEFPSRDCVPAKPRELADRGAPAATVPGG